MPRHHCFLPPCFICVFMCVCVLCFYHFITPLYGHSTFLPFLSTSSFCFKPLSLTLSLSFFPSLPLSCFLSPSRYLFTQKPHHSVCISILLLSALFPLFTSCSAFVIPHWMCQPPRLSIRSQWIHFCSIVEQTRGSYQLPVFPGNFRIQNPQQRPQNLSPSKIWGGRAQADRDKDCRIHKSFS